MMSRKELVKIYASMDDSWMEMLASDILKPDHDSINDSKEEMTGQDEESPPRVNKDSPKMDR